MNGYPGRDGEAYFVLPDVRDDVPVEVVDERALSNPYRWAYIFPASARAAIRIERQAFEARQRGYASLMAAVFGDGE